MGNENLTTVELLFLRQTGNYIVAEDEEGKERWFDIRKTTCEVAGEDLTVTLPTKEWMRRVNNKEVQIRSDRVTVRRICICCKAPRDMEQQNRICDDCKSTADWRAGRSPFAL